MGKNVDTYGMSIGRDKAQRLATLADHYGVTIPELLESIFNIGMDLMAEAMDRIPKVSPKAEWDVDVDSFGSPW